MIWGALIEIVIGFMMAVLGLFPVVHIGELESFAFTVGGGLALAETYFPVTLLASCMGAVMGLRLAMVLWQFVVFVYENFPGKAT